MLNTPINPVSDPGYCGLDLSPSGPDAETGMWDPYWKKACQPHDRAYDELIAGTPTQTNIQTQLNFAGAATSVAAQGFINVVTFNDVAKGAYAVVTYPLYLTIGSIGGFFRWAYLDMTLNSQN